MQHIVKIITLIAVSLLLSFASTASAQSNTNLSTLTDNYTAQNGDVLTGSTSHNVTIANGASITLNNATITGGIVCEGSATITLVGTNSVSGATEKAGIQIGSSGTTLTIKGDGSLTATGGSAAAGIGLGRTWDASVTAGAIVIEGGTVNASGDIGIGIGTVGNDQTASIDGISIKGGTVCASLGKGYIYGGSTVTIGYIKIYDTIDMVDASKITETVTYMHVDGESATDVTANKTDYFTITIGQDGDRRIIVPKDDTDYTITLADGIEHGTITGATTAKYMETVTINATPDFGYRLVRLVVKDAQNNDVASTGNTFLMPKGNVTVSAVFEQGTHGTTEFVWRYSVPGSFVNEATIYDGLTTVNIQTGRRYNIKGYPSTNFRLDNDINEAYIPYAGGTGKFVQINPTAFYVTDNNALGYYDITLTDVGNDKWSVSIQKTVPVIDNIPDQTYTGSAITPEPLVVAGSLDLTKGTDYEYFYENNTNSGTATVTVTFEGDYVSLGSVEKTFEIVQKNTLGALTITEYGDRKTAVLNGNYTIDATPVILSEDIEVNSITIDRTFTVGVTSTIILPFSVESGKYSGGTFYEFTSVDYKNGKWEASMTKVTGKIEAHKPYLFVPSSDKLTITGSVTLEATSEEEYSDTKGDWTFNGVFKVKNWATGVKRDYFFASTAATSTEGNAVSAGDFVRIGNECGLSPFRCYLSYTGSESSLTKSDKQLPSSIEVRLIDEIASVVEPENPESPSDNGDIVTPVSEIAPDNVVKVWSYNRTIYIESQPGTDYTVVDLNGRTLTKGVTRSTREEVTLSRATGIVIVKVNGKTFKIY